MHGRPLPRAQLPGGSWGRSELQFSHLRLTAPAVRGDVRFKERRCQAQTSHRVRGGRDCPTGEETEAQGGQFACLSHSSAFHPRTLCLQHPCFFPSALQLGLIAPAAQMVVQRRSRSCPILQTRNQGPEQPVQGTPMDWRQRQGPVSSPGGWQALSQRAEC